MADPTDARVRRDGDALAFAGALDRAAVTGLWPQALAASAGAQRIVLTEVTIVDSAGLAMLAELAPRLRAAGGPVALEGEPPGLPDLRAAYRLTPGLDYPA